MKNFEIVQPDLIIASFSMPGTDATSFLQELRNIPALEETPVIVISDNRRAESRRRVLISGATDFMTVPLDTFEFQVRVRNLLRLGLHQKFLRTNSPSLKQKLIQTRLRALKANRPSREHFTNVIDCVPAIVFAINDVGECVFSNEYCYEFLGYEANGANEKTASLHKIMNVIKQANFSPLENNSFITEIKLPDKKGEEHIFLLITRVVQRSAAHDGLVVFSGIDISGLKRTESSLRMAKAEAEAANRAKGAFLANMSHEIRTPLNAIIGFADIILSETFGPLQNERYREYMKDILNSSKHLLFVINEILDFSQMEHGRHSVSISKFSLLECTKSVRRMVGPQLTKKRNKLIVEANRDFTLYSDSQKLTQVLLNIIINANKFMQGGIIRLDARRNGEGELVLTIEDQGIGMTDEEIAIAVSHFGQISNPT